MDPDDLEARLRADEIAAGFLRPRYDDYCFANVPATAAAAIGVDQGPTVPPEAVADVDGVERVVVFVVDGFGWAQWQRDVSDHAAFGTLGSAGTVVPLTTIYPSETAACMTTFHTGEPPARHGLIGWDVYVEELDVVIEPLPYRTADGGAVDRHATDTGVEVLFEGEARYDELVAAGVHATAVHPADTVDSPYSRRVFDGVDVAAYDGPKELAAALVRALSTGPTPQFVHGYYPAVDKAAHRHGTDSAAHRSALEGVDAAIAALVDRVDPAVAAETLLLVTADHGEVDTDPGTNVDLRSIDGLRECLRRGRDGTPVPPVGGPRNLHFHAAEGRVEVLRDRLERALDALVLDRADYLDAGLFGDVEPSTLFDARAGDLVVVPREGSVWDGATSAALEYVGMHGGLDPRELLVPLASARLSALGG